jgi:ACS family allantoate permease-like MFS transporter
MLKKLQNQVIMSASAGVDVNSVGHSKAQELLAHHHVDFDPDSAEAKRVLRKIDMRLMPMIFMIYLLQLMDKNSLSFAAIMGIRRDANLTPSQYSWLGSIV